MLPLLLHSVTHVHTEISFAALVWPDLSTWDTDPFEIKIKFLHILSAPKVITTGFPRSPEAKKRKAPPIKGESKNGPSAKKTKPSAKSSSSEESSSDGEKEAGKPPKSTLAGSITIMCQTAECIHLEISSIDNK